MKQKRSSLVEGMLYASNTCNSIIGYAPKMNVLGDTYTPALASNEDSIYPILFDANNMYIKELDNLFLKRYEGVSTPCYYKSKKGNSVFLCCKNFIIKRCRYSTEILAGVYKNSKMNYVILVSNFISHDNDTKKVIMSILESESDYEKILLRSGGISGFVFDRNTNTTIYPSTIENQIFARMSEDEIDKSLVNAQNADLLFGAREFSENLASIMKRFMNVNIHSRPTLVLEPYNR